MRNAFLATRVFNVPLMAHPDKAEIVARMFTGESTVYEPQAEHAGIVGDLMAARLERANYTPFPIVEKVAVIGIKGTLVASGGYIGQSSGVMSYQGIQAQLARAGRLYQDGAIRGVAFEFNSFGGEVQSAFETAAMMAKLSAAVPTMAICSSNACSAAYLLASQTRRIIAPQDGCIGSIGSVIMHIDQSKWLDNEGIKVTFVHAGAQKVAGNPHEPLPDDVRSKMQARVDATRERFADAVASGRSRLTRQAALDTEADAYDGTEALSLGLIDAVAEPSAAFAAFRAAIN